MRRVSVRNGVVPLVKNDGSLIGHALRNALGIFLVIGPRILGVSFHLHVAQLDEAELVSVHAKGANQFKVFSGIDALWLDERLGRSKFDFHIGKGRCGNMTNHTNPAT